MLVVIHLGALGQSLVSSLRHGTKKQSVNHTIKQEDWEGDNGEAEGQEEVEQEPKEEEEKIRYIRGSRRRRRSKREQPRRHEADKKQVEV